MDFESGSEISDDDENEQIEEVTRRINSGVEDINYLNHWLRIGENNNRAWK